MYISWIRGLLPSEVHKYPALSCGEAALGSWSHLLDSRVYALNHWTYPGSWVGRPLHRDLSALPSVLRGCGVVAKNLWSLLFSSNWCLSFMLCTMRSIIPITPRGLVSLQWKMHKKNFINSKESYKCMYQICSFYHDNSISQSSQSLWIQLLLLFPKEAECLAGFLKFKTQECVGRKHLCLSPLLPTAQIRRTMSPWRWRVLFNWKTTWIWKEFFPLPQWFKSSTVIWRTFFECPPLNLAYLHSLSFLIFQLPQDF